MAKYQKMYEEELSKNDQLNGLFLFPSFSFSRFYYQTPIYFTVAQINHLIRKSESQTRDLKKTMNENAQALAEFEKALIRKSEECNVSNMFQPYSNGSNSHSITDRNYTSRSMQ